MADILWGVYALLADAIVVLHLGFVVFVVAGGLLALRWPRVAWVHLPCAAWGALIELAGWVCPLTPLENELRARAGEVGYGGGFIEHYVLPILYPGALTRDIQLLLGALVIGVNVVVYALVWRRRRGGAAAAGRATEAGRTAKGTAGVTQGSADDDERLPPDRP